MQVKEYLAGIETLVAKAGDRGRALVKSLVEHHGLSTWMLDGKNIKIAMTLAPPGTTGEPVTVETVATIPADEDEVDRWVKEQNVKGRKCACGCGRTVAVLRRHYWIGLPKFHGECRHKAMAGRRAAIAGDKYINGTELAKRLGIGRSTLKRWVEAGKLPKPEKSISGMWLFDRAAVC